MRRQRKGRWTLSSLKSVVRISYVHVETGKTAPSFSKGFALRQGSHQECATLLDSYNSQWGRYSKVCTVLYVTRERFPNRIARWQIAEGGPTVGCTKQSK